MQLSIISVEVMRYWLANNDTTQWPGVESEKKRSKNRLLWSTKGKVSFFERQWSNLTDWIDLKDRNWTKSWDLVLDTNVLQKFVCLVSLVRFKGVGLWRQVRSRYRRCRLASIMDGDIHGLSGLQETRLDLSGPCWARIELRTLLYWLARSTALSAGHMIRSELRMSRRKASKSIDFRLRYGIVFW